MAKIRPGFCAVCNRAFRQGDALVPVKRWHAQIHNEPSEAYPATYMHLRHVVTQEDPT